MASSKKNRLDGSTAFHYCYCGLMIRSVHSLNSRNVYSLGLLQNGTLKLTDRKKNIFKLAQGEYIAPEKIEMIYNLSEPVAQVFVHGESLQVRNLVFQHDKVEFGGIHTSTNPSSYFLGVPSWNSGT